MRILYIFPHPDDESFGPARTMAAERRQGHDVYLLTFTRGEATKVRHKFAWTLEQMGQARYSCSIRHRLATQSAIHWLR